MQELQAQLRRHAAGLWRRRWIAVAVAWLICLTGWAGVANIPDSYEASARLYVDSDEVLTPLLHGLALDNSLSNQIEVLQRTLLSRPNIEKLISKTDLDLQVRGPAKLEELVAELERAIHITPQTRNLFTITYRNPSPQLAHDVVNTVLNIFIESKIGHNRSDMENARVFVEQQIAGYERKLREAETKRAEFRTKYIDLLPGDGGTSRLDAARIQVRSLEGLLADAVGRRDRLTQEISVTPPTLVVEIDPGSVTAGGGDLAAAQRHLQELLTTETEQHPDVVRQRRLIEQLRRTAAAAPTAAASVAPVTGSAPPASASGASASGAAAAPASLGRPARSVAQPNTVYERLKVLQVQAESDVASLKRQVADATGERDRLEEIARSAPGVQAQFINLDRDYDVVRKNYDELVARREQMRLSAAADTDADKVRMQVIDPPQVPHVPVGPKRPLLLSGVLLAGLGGGVAATILLCKLDQSFYNLHDLRGLGLPVAGAISLQAGAPRIGRRVVNVAAVAVALLLLCGVYGGLVLQVLHGGWT